MSSYLQGADEFSFSSQVNYDQVLESGQKILYGRRAEIAIGGRQNLQPGIRPARKRTPGYDSLAIDSGSAPTHCFHSLFFRYASRSLCPTEV